MMNRRPAKIEAPAQDEAGTIAQSLRRDFLALIAIFDRHHSSGAAKLRNADLNITEARAAAERGLRLSEELSDLLRSTDG